MILERPWPGLAGARLCQEGPPRQRCKVIMSYPGKLARAARNACGELGDVRSRASCRVGQQAAAFVGGGHPVIGARKGLLGACLTGPACRKALAEHQLMEFSTGELHLRPRAPVVRIAVVANRRVGTVRSGTFGRRPQHLQSI